MLDFEAWNVDVPAGMAVHATGFVIVIEGDPAEPMGVTPGRFPESLSTVQQATLLRCGIEALTKAALVERRNSANRHLSAVASPSIKVKTTKSRPILSLKS